VKKVRISIAEGCSEPQSFLLFNSAEALYEWLDDGTDDPSSYMGEAEDVVIAPGEYIEAEWRGCEYVYDGPDHQRLDYVRVAKAAPTENASGMLVTIHFGWTVEEELPFSECEDEDIVVKRLGSDDKQLDLALLFKDDEEG